MLCTVGFVSGQIKQVLVMGWILLVIFIVVVVRCSRFGVLVVIVVLTSNHFSTSESSKH